MRDSKFFRLISIFLLLLFVQGFGHGELNLNSYLVKHSIYGEQFIQIGDRSSTPKSGIVGTKGNFTAQECIFSTEVRCLELITNWDKATFDNTSSLYTTSIDKCNVISFADPSKKFIDPKYPYDTETPVLPTNSEMSFIVGGSTPLPSGNTLTEGSYGDLKFSGKKYLTAGTYYFKNIDIGPGSQLVIIPNGASYKTSIYVEQDFQLGNATAKFGPGDASGVDDEAKNAGNVLLVMKGSKQIFFGDHCKFVATLVAPNAEVKFGDNSNLSGQVLADKISSVSALNGGDGFDFIPITTANISITPPESIDEDPNMDPNTTLNNISQITVTLSEEIPDENGDDGSPNYATLNWELLDGGQEWDIDYKSSAGKNGTITFSHGVTQATIPLEIIDESDYDPNESFTIKFTKGSENIKKFEIDFGASSTLEHIIKINNDDLDNQPPTDINLTNYTVDEEKGTDAFVGNIIVTDDNGIKGVAVTNSAHFKVNVSGSDYQLVTTANFDYENVSQRTHSVELTATDLGDLTFAKSVTVTVNPKNDNQCLTAKSTFSVAENSQLTNVAINSSPNLTDADELQNLNRFKFSVVKNPLYHSSFNLTEAGLFNYKPNPALEVLKDSFSYTVVDSATYDGSNGHISPETWVIIDITPVNDNNPVITVPLELSLKEGETKAIGNLFTDADINDSHVLAIVSQSEPTAGTATIINGDQIQYATTSTKSVEKFTDLVTFTVTDDGGNGIPVQGVLTVNIDPQNDNEPNPSLDTITVIQGDLVSFTHNIVTKANSNDVDIDLDEHPTLSNTNQLQITAITGEDANYCQSLVIKNSYEITYTVDPNAVIPAGGAIDILEYTIQDPVNPQYDTKVNSGQDSVFVKVVRNPKNNPVANDDNLTVDEGKSGSVAVMGNDAKKVADLSHVTKLSDPTHGTVSLDVATNTFTYTHDDSENFSDQFTYTLHDKAGYTSTATVNIVINKLNDNPQDVNNQSATVDEGGSKSIQVTDVPTNENDKDVETTFEVELKGINGGAKYGTVTKNVDGISFTYFQDKDYGGNKFDTVVINNMDKTPYDNATYPFHTKEDTIFITINPLNTESPTTTDFNITIKEHEDTVIALTGFIDDADLPDDILTLTIKSQTNKAGTATFDNAAKTITYTADPNVLTEEWDDVIVYTITDDGGKATDGTITMKIEPLNDNSPVANRDSVDVQVGQITTVDIMLDNDTDADKNPAVDPRLTDDPIKTGPTNPNGITVAKVGDNRSITVYFDENIHNAVYVDSIEYEIEDPVNYDATVNKATGWLIIRAVVPDDNDPIGVQDRIELLEDGTATSLVGGATNVLTNDKENKVGTNLASVELVDDVDFGVLTLNPDGTFEYKHNDVEEFNDKFTYRAIDALGNKSFETQVIIAIDTLNDKEPTITDDVLTVDEGDSNSVDILDNDDDIDILTQWQTSIVAGKGQNHGTVTKNPDGTFKYVHDGSENPSVGTRIDSFFVEVVDFTDYDPTTHPTENKVIVTINPVNENPPVANDGVFATIDEGQSTDLDISSLYSDPDMPNDVLTVEIVNDTTPAGVAVLVGNTVTYTHNLATEIFTDNIIYKVTDAEGNSDNGTLSITINPINDNIPVITQDTVSVRQGDTTFTFVVTDDDKDADLPADQTTLKIVAPADTVLTTYGKAIRVDDSTFKYISNINFEIVEGVSDKDFFVYTISDEVPYDTKVNNSVPDTVFINLLKDELGYPKTLNDSLSLKENETVNSVWSIMANDTLGYASLKSIDIIDDVDHGILTMNDDGTFTYAHDSLKEEFTDQFIYTLTDSVGNVSNASLVTLHIDTLNDNLPVITNENLTVDEGGTAQINVLTTETDADIYTTLTPALAGVNGGALYGTVTMTPDGTITYVNDGTEGITSDMVIVNISDVTTYDVDSLHTLPDTVFITINPVNENPPVGTAPSYNLLEGGTLAVIDSAAGLLHDATDGDIGIGNSLSAVLVTKPLYHNVATAGEFAVNPNGTFTYVHDDSENFKDSIIYDISDGLNTIRLTAIIDIAPVNDNAPTALPDTCIGIEGGTISPVTSVLANDNDIDLYLDGLGGTITTPLHAVVDPLQLPTQGSVLMTPDGLFTYTHNGSETVNDSFAYIVIDTMQGITFTNTAKVYITIPQVAPVADSAFYYDEDGNGVVEEVIVHFNDSIDVTTTTFAASWEEDAAPVTVLSATNVGTTGTEVSLVLDGSPVHRTSGVLAVAITHGANFDNLVASVRAQDKAAPTVTAATYYYDETAQGNDSIRVFFSEDVTYFPGNPYNYLDVSTGAEFSMSVTPLSHVGSVITYAVNSKTIKQVNSGDSIQINIADIALDTLDNYQDLTIWAPITLEGKYPVEFEFMIVPQPMLFIKIGDKKQEAAPLNEGMMTYYNFPATSPKNGVAFILYAKMPLADAALQKCTYTILDQTGNVVQEAQPLTFTLNADSEITGVGVWEGKNQNGRVVAKSSYLVVVDAQIMTENGEIIPFHTEKPIATYGIYE